MGHIAMQHNASSNNQIVPQNAQRMGKYSIIWYEVATDIILLQDSVKTWHKIISCDIYSR